MESSLRDSPPPGWESQQQQQGSPPPPGFESNDNNNSPPSQKQLLVVESNNKKNYSPSQHCIIPDSPLPPTTSPYVDSPSSSQCQPQSSGQDSAIPTPEMGQMICGVCRSLISYPKGAGRVKCPGCQTVNHVLEAQQVGLVKCGSCSVLLMYKYESSSVRCSCCRSVTQIGVDNKRPLISVQQVHSPSPNTVQ